METDPSSPAGGDRSRTEPIALSTRRTVALPPSPEATMLGLGATFAAPRERVDALLPEGVRPIRVWGYPKVVAAITHRDRDDRRRTTVAVDGERVLTLEVARPPAVARRAEGYTYSDAVSVSFGTHDRAAPLAGLDLGSRALARVPVAGE